ncbi:permease [Geoalkalibacter sp.]|uniref:permease n=1 Tax=Geoalkalibacter sp. TaxID=3041440 RepID=UPI00272E453E|nr:permease [Geoalkalibacter sp.]
MPDSALLQVLSVIRDEIARMWWFFLLACLLVGVIKGYKLDLKIRNLVNRAGIWGIVLAVLVGMVSPLCACGILPIVISLAMMGTPLPPLMALLATSPTMGPDALLLTWRGLGAELAVWKIVGSGFLGLSAGLVTQALVRQGYLAGELLKLKPVFREDGSLASAAEIGAAHGIAVKTMSIKPRESRLRFILDRTLDAALFTGKFLLLAIVLEALIVTFVPISWIVVLVGQESILSLVNAALIGLPLPTNQIPIIPILAGLLQRGIDQGAALTLLMAGPVTSLPAMIALGGMFQFRVVAVFVALGLSGSVLLGWVHQVFF